MAQSGIITGAVHKAEKGRTAIGKWQSSSSAQGVYNVAQHERHKEVA